MDRNPTAKLRPFGECLVHSAKTASSFEQNACIAYVHSADTYVHSANYAHSAPNGPKPEALGGEPEARACGEADAQARA